MPIGMRPHQTQDRLAGIVVKASVSGAQDPGFESRLRRDFSGSSHTSDFKIGTPVATLPGAWWYRVCAGTGWPGVSILWLGEMESLICSFHLGVAARRIVWADPSLRHTLACCWDVRQRTNKQTVPVSSPPPPFFTGSFVVRGFVFRVMPGSSIWYPRHSDTAGHAQ